MDKIFRTIGKYWFPVTCIIVGLVILILSGGPNPQPSGVYYGAIAILLVGIIALLFLKDIIKKPIRVALTVVFALASVFFISANSTSISDEIELMEKKKLNNAMTIQALKDIRNGQEAYRSVHGSYTQDLGELVKFIQTGTVPKIKKINAIPDSIGTEANARELDLIKKMPAGMTDQQVKEAGIIVRDTIQIAVMEDRFTNEIALKARKFDFDIEQIKYAPTSGKPWNIKAGITNIGGVEQPVLEVTDPEPFKSSKREEALKIGSMDDAHLNGNWKEN